MRTLNTRPHDPGRRQLKIDRPNNQLYANNSKRWWNSLPTWYHSMTYVGQFNKVINSDPDLLNELQ